MVLDQLIITGLVSHSIGDGGATVCLIASYLVV